MSATAAYHLALINANLLCPGFYSLDPRGNHV